MSLTSETVRDEEEEETYCVCRGPYGNKFMIACDECEEWFHGSCIGINSEQAKSVDKYFCPFCREKNPSLKTIYKAKAKDVERRRLKEKHREKQRRKEEKRRREEKKAARQQAAASEEEAPSKKKDSSLKKKTELTKEEYRALKRQKEEKYKLQKEELRRARVKSNESRSSQADESTPRPSTTVSKSPKEPTKFKIPKESYTDKQKGKIKEEKYEVPPPAVEREDQPKKKEDKIPEPKPKKKEDKIVEPKPKKKEDKIVEPKPKKKEDKIVEPKPKKKEDKIPEPKHKVKKEDTMRPELIIKKEEYKPIKDEVKQREGEPKVKKEEVKIKREDMKIKREEIKLKKEPVEPTEPAKPTKKAPAIHESDDDDEFNSFLSSMSKKPAPVISSEDEDIDVGMSYNMVPETCKVKDQSKQNRASATKRRNIKKKDRQKKHSAKPNGDENGHEDKLSSEEEERQCIGPGCCNGARRRSRYCSDECGVSLAVKRIKTFLPDRKAAMLRGGGAARATDDFMIRDLEKQQEVAHQRIEELQNQRLIIMNLMESAKSTIIESNSEEDMSEDEGDNEEVDCVICGMSCSDKNAVRHMERCYNKAEGKCRLWNTVKCHVTWECPVCDAYDRQEGTYCKRLRVICPDHNKEKEDHDGMCGCPLDFSTITVDNVVCRKRKRACNKHTCWEKLRLAEIDSERISQHSKLEISFDEMRKVKYRLLNRASLLQVLLNGTIIHEEAQEDVEMAVDDHDPNPSLPPQEEGLAAPGEHDPSPSLPPQEEGLAVPGEQENSTAPNSAVPEEPASGNEAAVAMSETTVIEQSPAVPAVQEQSLVT